MIRQTFNRNLKNIQDMLGINIKCRIKGGYYYYIDGKEDLKLHSFKSWMLDSLSINNTLMHYGSLKDRLLMEHIPSGTEYFQKIVRAMKEISIMAKPKAMIFLRPNFADRIPRGT